MAKNLFIPKGLVRELDSDKGYGFNLTKFFRNQLEKLGVSFHDECCPDASTGAPVRWFDGHLQRYDASTKTYINITTLS